MSGQDRGGVGPAGTGTVPSLGASIKARRLELGLSQEGLAERASGPGEEVRQSDVSRLERGRVALPRRARLARIAAALDLSLGELLARSGWAGAEAAFPDEAAGPAARAGTAANAPAGASAAAGPARGSDAEGAEAVERHGAAAAAGGRVRNADPALPRAVARAHELETWSADLLRQAAITVERAARAADRRRAAPEG